jgi:hypothetical protein
LTALLNQTVAGNPWFLEFLGDVLPPISDEVDAQLEKVDQRLNAGN